MITEVKGIRLSQSDVETLLDLKLEASKDGVCFIPKHALLKNHKGTHKLELKDSSTIVSEYMEKKGLDRIYPSELIDTITMLNSLRLRTSNKRSKNNEELINDLLFKVLLGVNDLFAQYGSTVKEVVKEKI